MCLMELPELQKFKYSIKNVWRCIPIFILTFTITNGIFHSSRLYNHRRKSLSLLYLYIDSSSLACFECFIIYLRLHLVYMSHTRRTWGKGCPYDNSINRYLYPTCSCAIQVYLLYKHAAICRLLAFGSLAMRLHKKSYRNMYMNM